MTLTDIYTPTTQVADQIHAYLVLRSAWTKTFNHQACVILNNARVQVVDSMSVETYDIALHLYNLKTGTVEEFSRQLKQVFERAYQVFDAIEHEAQFDPHFVDIQKVANGSGFPAKHKVVNSSNTKRITK
jgi:hypothetical protein